MDEIEADKLARAYSRLASLRDTLAAMTTPELAATYVDEFHRGLDRLSEIGLDVEEFRVGPPEMRVVMERDSYMGRASRHSEHRYIERGLLLSKVRTVVSYFEFNAEEPRRPMGFRP